VDGGGLKRVNGVRAHFAQSIDGEAWGVRRRGCGREAKRGAYGAQTTEFTYLRTQ